MNVFQESKLGFKVITNVIFNHTAVIFFSFFVTMDDILIQKLSNNNGREFISMWK